MDVEYSTEKMFKIFQNQLPSIVHRIIMPGFLYNILLDAPGRHTGMYRQQITGSLMTSVLTELFGYQVSGMVIPRLVCLLILITKIT